MASSPEDDFDKAVADILGGRAGDVNETSRGLLRQLWDRATAQAEQEILSPQIRDLRLAEGASFIEGYHLNWMASEKAKGYKPSSYGGIQDQGIRREYESKAHEIDRKLSAKHGRPVVCERDCTKEITWENLSDLQSHTEKPSGARLLFFLTPVEFMTSFRKMYITDPLADQLKPEGEMRPVFGTFFGIPLIHAKWLDSYVYAATFTERKTWDLGRLKL